MGLKGTFILEKSFLKFTHSCHVFHELLEDPLYFYFHLYSGGKKNHLLSIPDMVPSVENHQVIHKVQSHPRNLAGQQVYSRPVQGFFHMEIYKINAHSECDEES